MKCWNCGFENPPNSKFCNNCGESQERPCPNCGTKNPAGAKFCNNCGYNLQAAAGGASAPAAPKAQTRPAESPQALIEKYMPKEIASKLEAARASRSMEGERRIVTILFCDVKGSTAMAEMMDPEEWADIMNRAFQYLIEPVYRYEGTVARLMGDAILAFFGAPIAHEDDPQRATLAALDILNGIAEYREKVRQEKDLEFAVRVGLNTGLVVVGNIGSDLKYEYTAMGDAINLASRMQNAADPNTILISENTHRQIVQLFEFEDRGELDVKGKTEPVHVYRVLAANKGAVKTRGIAGLGSPMVGRRREFSTLMQILDDLREGRGSIVSIIGEAGLGKSRLVAEWQRAAFAAVGSDRLRWVEGRCLSYGAAMAHHLSTDIMRGLIGAPAGSSEEETRTALRQTLEQVLGLEMNDVYPYLGHLLGIKLEEEMAARVKYLDGPALQAKYIAATRRLLQAMAKSAPTVIVCEDIHWADPSSVELGMQVLPIVAETRLVIVFVTRQDKEAPGWKLIQQGHEVAGAGAIELYLAPLSENDSKQLVSNLLEVEALPESLRQLILAKAEGNPFFVEEVIRMLIDRGGIQRQDSQWIVTREIQNIEIPDTLQGVLTARIDRLPEDAKRTLQIASVIGRKFPVKILAAVMEQEGLF
jgi:class 3 adenylate cyclase/ribosomal protein L40E